MKAHFSKINFHIQPGYFLLLIVLIIIIGGSLYFRQFFPKKTYPAIRNASLICDSCNIIFVSFDTLRAANVHALGYIRSTTPTIDQFAQKGFTFTNAISVASWTLPSTMSWFTGVYPSRHKVVNKFTVPTSGQEEISNLKKLSPDIQTLAEILKNNGYHTAGFTGGAGVNHEFGFNQGFDVYTDDKEFAGFEDTVPKALEWIKTQGSSKFFLFLHGYNIHGQYVPERGYDKRFVDFNYQGKLTGSKEEQKDLREEGLAQGHIFLTKDDVRFLTDLYDEKIKRADWEFNKFVEEYKLLGLMDKTVFIITSDHGEELYEHGRIDHGHTLYDELLHVPLIITIPIFQSGMKIDSQVRSIDIMPTILSIAGVPLDKRIQDQMQGQSLTSLMQGKVINLDAYAETDYRYAVFKRSLRTSGQLKYITDLETKFDELYDLKTDKEEKNNLADNTSANLPKLRLQLQEFLDNIKRNTL